MFFLSSVPVRAPRAPNSEEPCRQRCAAGVQQHPASECGVSVSRLTAPDLPFRGREHARRISGALAAAMPSLAPKLQSHSLSKLYHKRGTQSKLETGVSSDYTYTAFGRSATHRADRLQRFASCFLSAAVPGGASIVKVEAAGG